MDISYLGHSSFKLRGKQSTLVTDPFSSSVGFSFPRVSTDVVTISHDHSDHNNTTNISGTARRSNPFIINYPGEYEVSGTSVFGVRTFHDTNKGAERGLNTVFVIHIDDVALVHLGDLGHELSDRQVEEIGDNDVVFLPVGGVYTIGPKEAAIVINQLQPSVVVPMHYRTLRHDKKTFGELSTLDEFLQEGGFEKKEMSKKLSLTRAQLPEEMEVLAMTT